jgi:hypothetical protein
MHKYRLTPHRRMLLGLALMLAAGWAGVARATDWFVAPTGATITAAPTGSESDPFATVAAAFASGKVKGGDRVLLKNGTHAAVLLRNLAFDTQVTIMSQNKRLAHIESVLIRDVARNLRLFSLTVRPSDPAKAPGYLVEAAPTTSDIVVESLTISSGKDASQFMDWDAAKWNTRRFSGIRLDGPRSSALRNRIIGLYNGVSLGGDNSQAVRNLINGYNGDGLRGLGNNNVFMANRVFNCVDTDDNHDDGFQSFAGSSGVIRGLVLNKNVIVEWLGAANHPLRCRLQGIGLFDGFYDDLTITNNLVATTQYHGISVYGTRRARIINNTVVNGDGITSVTPYIMVTNHKNGTPSTDVLVANNIAMSIRGTASVANRVEFRSNSTIGTPGAVFENPIAFDYRPKSTSGFIDSADITVAPRQDLLSQPRPSGAKPDRGAYETQINAPSASTASLLSEATEETDNSAAETSGSTATGAKWIKIP